MIAVSHRRQLAWFLTLALSLHLVVGAAHVAHGDASSHADSVATPGAHGVHELPAAPSDPAGPVEDSCPTCRLLRVAPVVDGNVRSFGVVPLESSRFLSHAPVERPLPPRRSGTSSRAPPFLVA